MKTRCPHAVSTPSNSIVLSAQIVSRETNGDGITRILEATGSDQVISGMFSLLRKGGQVIMVGLPKTALHVENAAHNIGRPRPI